MAKLPISPSALLAALKSLTARKAPGAQRVSSIIGPAVNNLSRNLQHRRPSTRRAPPIIESAVDNLSRNLQRRRPGAQQVRPTTPQTLQRMSQVANRLLTGAGHSLSRMPQVANRLLTGAGHSLGRMSVGVGHGLDALLHRMAHVPAGQPILSSQNKQQSLLNLLRLLFSPSYPLLDRAAGLSRNPFKQLSTRSFDRTRQGAAALLRGVRTSVGLGAVGSGAYNFGYYYPRQAAEQLGRIAELSEEDVEKLYRNLRGLNVLKHLGWVVGKAYLPESMGGAKHPETRQLLRDVLRSGLNANRAGLEDKYQHAPWMAYGRDAVRSMTPTGLAVTAGVQGLRKPWDQETAEHYHQTQKKLKGTMQAPPKELVAYLRKNINPEVQEHAVANLLQKKLLSFTPAVAQESQSVRSGAKTISAYVAPYVLREVDRQLQTPGEWIGLSKVWRDRFRGKLTLDSVAQSGALLQSLYKSYRQRQKDDSIRDLTGDYLPSELQNTLSPVLDQTPTELLQQMQDWRKWYGK